jgi:hypothetical protein
MMKCLACWLLVLLFVSFGMAGLHWLSAPEGSGASAWSEALSQLGYAQLGAVLRSISRIEAVAVIGNACERTINAPRNELLHGLGYLYEPDSIYYYAAPHQSFSGDGWSVLMFACGTVVVYLPLVFGIALSQVSGWRLMKKPVLIAVTVFVAAAGTFGLMSNAEGSSKSATIFTALSLLTAAVGITWTPLLTPGRRLAMMVVLLVIVSGVGMVVITRSTGPSDALSYPIFFGWTLAVLIAEGGAFLLLVGGINRLLSRGRAEPPPSRRIMDAR